MFVSRAKYEAAVIEGAVRKEALDEARRQMQAMRAEIRTHRKEIKRLTNVIIQMKDRGKELDPVAGDRRWGTYTFDEIDEKGRPDPLDELPEPTADEKETALAEAELRAEIEAALDAEIE